MSLYSATLSGGKTITYAECHLSYKRAVHNPTGKSVEIVGCQAGNTYRNLNKLLVLFLGSPNQSDLRLVDLAELTLVTTM